MLNENRNEFSLPLFLFIQYDGASEWFKHYFSNFFSPPESEYTLKYVDVRSSVDETFVCICTRM